MRTRAIRLLSSGHSRSRWQSDELTSVIKTHTFNMSTCSTSAHESSRRDNWDDEQVRALITLWSDETVQAELKGSGRNLSIYRRLAARLARLCGDLHPERNAVSCRTKIKALTQAYKKVKDHYSRSGHGRHTFRYYDELDVILGTRPTTSPLNYVDTYALSAQGDDSPQELVVAAEEEVDQDVLVDVEVEFDSEGAGPAEREETQPTPGGSRDTTPTQAPQPRLRKRKERHVGQYEKFLASLSDKFLTAQDASADRYHEREDKRLKLELEMEDRLQERELANQAQQRLHQERMLQLLLTIHHPPQPQ